MTPPPRPQASARAFVANHLGDLISVDFFTMPTARCQVLFCFLVLAHDGRRVLHFNVTDHPTADWTAQQMPEAFPWDTDLQGRILRRVFLPLTSIRPERRVVRYDLFTASGGKLYELVQTAGKDTWELVVTDLDAAPSPAREE